VVLVEDDDGMRSALERLLDIAGYTVESFASAEDCLAAGAASRDSCREVGSTRRTSWKPGLAAATVVSTMLKFKI